MYGDGEPSENAPEPGGADQASTSGSSGEALSKQSHDNPVFVLNATASASGGEQQSPDVRDGEARINSAPEGPASTPLKDDAAGPVPSVLSPNMFPGNGTTETMSTGTTPVETFPPGALPFGAFAPGISPFGTADGITIPQWMPVLFPVQMPLFMPSLPSHQTGQTVGFQPFPFYGLAGTAPGAPAGVEFAVPMNVPMYTEGNLPGATAGQQLAPPAVVGGQVPLGRPNGVAPVAQAQVPDQRRIVRRFQVGIQLDLLLLLKLAVIVFVFNQDGSKDRLLLLMGLACLVYLYQTNSLSPVLRWLAERAQQFMTPPQHLAQAQPRAQPAPDAQARDAPGAEAANVGAEELAAEGVGEAPAEGANAQIPRDPFLAFVKEVQMLVVGFVTSLLPGFHPHAD